MRTNQKHTWNAEREVEKKMKYEKEVERWKMRRHMKKKYKIVKQVDI